MTEKQIEAKLTRVEKQIDLLKTRNVALTEANKKYKAVVKQQFDILKRENKEIREANKLRATEVAKIEKLIKNLVSESGRLQESNAQFHRNIKNLFAWSDRHIQFHNGPLSDRLERIYEMADEAIHMG